MSSYVKWNPRRFKPSHLHVVRMHWNGMTNGEIAKETGYSYIHVHNIIASEEAQEILALLTSRTLDTIIDIQAEAQAAAPLVFEEKLKIALGCTDVRTKNSACTDILNMAGHQPIKRVQIQRSDIPIEFDSKSEEEIKKFIREEVAAAGTNATGSSTVH